MSPHFLESLDTVRQSRALGTSPWPGDAETVKNELKLRGLLSPQLILSDTQLVDHVGLHELAMHPRHASEFREFLAERTTVGMRPNSPTRKYTDLFAVLEYGLEQPWRFSGLSASLNKRIADRAAGRGGRRPMTIAELEGESQEGLRYVAGVRKLDEAYGPRQRRTVANSQSLRDRVAALQLPFGPGHLNDLWSELLSTVPDRPTRSDYYNVFPLWRRGGRLTRSEESLLKECVDAAYLKNLWDQDPGAGVVPVLSPRRYGAFGAIPPASRLGSYAQVAVNRTWEDVPINPVDLDRVSFEDLAGFRSVDPGVSFRKDMREEELAIAWADHLGRVVESFSEHQSSRTRHTQTVIARVAGLTAVGGLAGDALARGIAHEPALSVVLSPLNIPAAGALLAGWWLGWKAARRNQSVRRIATSLRQVELVTQMPD